MTTPPATASDCDQLEPFFDGALEPEAARAFRAHLATCPRCPDRLGELMYLQSLQYDAAAATAAIASATAAPAAATAAAPLPATTDGGTVIPMRARRRTLRIASVVVPLAAAAALGLLLVRPRPPVAPTTLALAEQRVIEPRLGFAPADRYRPYRPSRGDAGGETGLAPAIDQLVRAGDDRGAAAGWVLAGSPDRAEQLLATVPAAEVTAGHDADRAAIRLLQGRPDRALVLADAALARDPTLVQAHWNRGLALRDLGLPLAAAASFTAVVDRGEPGWSDEARRRGNDLRAVVAEARRRPRGADDDLRAAAIAQQVVNAAAVLATGTADDAWVIAERARGEARAAGLVDAEAGTLALLADIARRRNDRSMAAALDSERALRTALE